MSDSRDPLEVLLERSAPAGVSDSPRLRRDLAAMSTDARRAAAPSRRPASVALGIGLTVLLTGGAGAAVAATMFDWEPWAQNPDIAYPFHLPSGRQCEARVLLYEVTGIPTEGPVDRISDAELAQHFRDLDAIGVADIDASMIEVRQRDTSVSMVAVTPDGRLEDVHTTPEGPTADDLYAAAVSDALRDVLQAEAESLKLGDRWGANESIQCEAVAR